MKVVYAKLANAHIRTNSALTKKTIERLMDKMVGGAK